jgi:hypothetical protein
MKNEINKKLAEIHEKICTVENYIHLEEKNNCSFHSYRMERLFKEREFLIACEMELMDQLKSEMLYE